MARKTRLDDVHGGLYHLIPRGNARQDSFFVPKIVRESPSNSPTLAANTFMQLAKPDPPFRSSRRRASCYKETTPLEPVALRESTCRAAVVGIIYLHTDR
jgi:hypothetical protein